MTATTLALKRETGFPGVPPLARFGWLDTIRNCCLYGGRLIAAWWRLILERPMGC